MDSFLTCGITYGALDRALLVLGFQEETYETHRLYKKEEHGAVVVLPRTEMNEEARAVHLLTVRHTVTGMGIADEAEFEELLARQQETKPHKTTAFNSHTPPSRASKSNVPVAAPTGAPEVVRS